MKIVFLLCASLISAFCVAADQVVHAPVDTTIEKNPPHAEDGAILINIKQFKYLPAHVQVKKGAKLRWKNDEKRQYHNVWFQQLGEPEPPYLFSGDVYEKVFNEVGTFPYRCGPHPEMTGSVTVVTDEAVFTWEEAIAHCAKQGSRLPTLSELKSLLPTLGELEFWSSTEGIDTRQNPDLVRMLHEYGVGEGFDKKYAWYVSTSTQTSAKKISRFSARCVPL
jgi:plastocyanin